MKGLNASLKFLFFFFFLLEVAPVFGQVVPHSDTLPLPPTADTMREFEIIRGPSMRSIYIDSSTTLQTIAGGAIIKQGNTLFTGDSIVINPTTHIAEAFGNVHINQEDSLQTYAQYLKYVGTEKMAYLKKDVRLNDKKGTLLTQELDYNLGTKIGNYYNGGKVINGKTIITSKDGTYYADTKDIFFKNGVVVTQPKNHITTDSLLYNMNTESSNFYTNTHIKSKDADIYTTKGTYDMNTGNALFTTRTTVIDSNNRVYIANYMALDNKTGNAQLEGNALVKDSANGFIVLANQIFLNNKSNSFLATRKPVLIIKQKNDSIYIASDTIYSGFARPGKDEGNILKKDSSFQERILENFHPDTSKKEIPLKIIKGHPLKNEQDSSYYEAHVIDSLDAHNHPLPVKPTRTKILPIVKSREVNAPKPDSLAIDSSVTISKALPFSNMKSEKERLPENDSLAKIELRKDSVLNDSLKFTKKNIRPASSDSLKIEHKDSSNNSDTSRYFVAFHHVRIFSDSLQSVCDSLYFSTKDSVFRLYYDPVLWSGRTQITGDTIFLYTKNKKAERLYAFDKGIIVNKTTQGFFNQITGKTINGYFVNGAIDYMRVRGAQAESIYYAQDEDSAYLGMNRTTADVIDLYFKKDDLQKVLFVNNIAGKFYPMKKIPEDQRYLKNFIWLNDRRPKNKLELFE
jgi:lipopolysaccharide export system protein LptA